MNKNKPIDMDHSMVVTRMKGRGRGRTFVREIYIYKQNLSLQECLSLCTRRRGMTLTLGTGNNGGLDLSLHNSLPLVYYALLITSHN